MVQQNNNSRSAWDRVIEPWWAKMIIGAMALFAAWSEYVDFTRLESGKRESLLMGRSAVVLYDIGGKWLPVGLSIVAGLGFIAWGAFHLTRGKR